MNFLYFQGDKETFYEKRKGQYTKYVVRNNGHKLVCSCMKFQTESKCRHVDIITDIGPAWDTVFDGINTFNKSQVILDGDFAVYDDKGIVGLLYPPSADLSFDDLKPAFSGKKTIQELNRGHQQKQNYDRLVADLDSLVLNNTIAGEWQNEAPERKLSGNFTERKKTGQIWEKTPIPEHFWVEEDVWETLIYAAKTGTSALLTGHSGCGKTELCYLIAEVMRLPFEQFNMGATTEPRTMLVGQTHFNKDKGTWFNESRFVKAFKQSNGMILLDEFSRSNPDAFNILIPCLDNQRYLALDESENANVVQRGDNVAFFATANIGMEYTGTDEMDTALMDRFAVHAHLSFPPEEEEVRILQIACPKADNSDIAMIVSIANTQRKLAKEGDFTGRISTRMLKNACRMMHNGLPLEYAVRFAIVNRFSSDGEEESERFRVSNVFKKEGLI